MSALLAYQQQATSKLAFIEGDRQLSYSQLQQQVSQLSAVFLSKEANYARIAIALDRGIDASIAILATLSIGACYIPLDLKNPVKRLSYIVNDADVQCVIGKGPCPSWLNKSGLWLDIEQLPSLATELTQAQAIADDTLAAILYTSGSTGMPKGVALSHKAIQNFSEWAADCFNLCHTDQIASLAPFHFDLSTFDLFSSLSRGATVHFVPANLSFSPSRLTAWLQQQKITVWYTVPSILSFIALKGSLDNTPLPQLRSILFAGEVFPTPLLIKLCEHLPEVDFYNLYGPTETNVCCYWPVNRKQLQAEQPIPIGIAACNATLSVDSDSSELLVKSDNNLSGYWQQGQLIPACEVDNTYHTGDKVSLNQQGEYCYHGRLDRMLKCSGYRVEPAEIEQVILQQPNVENCAVIGLKDSTSGHRPATAIVLKTEGELSDISKAVKQQLPSYMHPCKFLLLDSLPYLANGKTDYLALQKQLESS